MFTLSLLSVKLSRRSRFCRVLELLLCASRNELQYKTVINLHCIVTPFWYLSLELKFNVFIFDPSVCTYFLRMRNSVIKCGLHYSSYVSSAGLEVLRISQPPRRVPPGAQCASVHARPQPPSASHSVPLHGQVS